MPAVILLIGFAVWESRTRIDDDRVHAKAVARSLGDKIASELRDSTSITEVDLEAAVRRHPELELIEIIVDDVVVESFQRARWNTASPAAILALIPLDDRKIRVGVRVGTQSASSWAQRAKLAIVAMAVLLITVGLAVGRTFSRFIERLTILANRLAEGNLTARGPVAGHELGQLGSAINSMADKLSQQQEEVLQMRNLALDAARSAREANQAKSEFLAHLSHEIRTPMTAILGYAELVLDPQRSPAETSRDLATIRSNAEHLLTVINETLDHAKIEAGQMAVEKIDTSPARVVAEVVTLLSGRAVAEGISLKAEFPERIPEFIASDPTRLRQVLVNLVGNAIKFTKMGSVKLITRFVAPNHGESFLAFQVVDTGIGMSPEQVATLFRPYVQGASSTTREYGGTGLGLVISQRFASLLGGGIHVESALGEGSTFTFVLKVDVENVPFHEPTLEELRAEHDSECSLDDGSGAVVGGRILVVDDNSDIRDLIASVVQRSGFEPVAVGDGEAACATMAAALREGSTFTAVLLDMRMPRLSGQDTARRLRHLGYPGKIVALTAISAKEREDAMRAGCDDHLPKPFRPSALAGYLKELTRPDVERGREPGAASLPPSATHFESSSPSAPPGPARPLDEPVETIANEFAEDPEMEEYITFFIERLPARLTLVEQALSEGDLAQLVGVAHDIKGIAGTVGYPTLSEQAEIVEELAQVTDDATANVDAIVAEGERLIELGKRVVQSRTW